MANQFLHRFKRNTVKIAFFILIILFNSLPIFHFKTFAIKNLQFDCIFPIINLKIDHYS